MTPERWEQISRLYYTALEVGDKERVHFLEEACSEDPDLRAEVESLLATHEQAGGFLGKPAMEEVARQLKEEPPSFIGRQLGPYQILGLLGAGGMGEVYKAKDTRLNRTVAIKVLPKHLAERKGLRQRFEREARAIAGLNHPHICALYDIGSHTGVDFLVMEYLEGEQLNERLKKGPLPLELLLQVAMEIASALEQAHRQGVIHRDLKPGNIMLTEGGAKLLDFGLAKQTGGTHALSRVAESDRAQSARSTRESLTETGMILGTLEYMAPEQVERRGCWSNRAIVPAFPRMADGLPAGLDTRWRGRSSLLSCLFPEGLRGSCSRIFTQWFIPPGLQMERTFCFMAGSNPKKKTEVGG